MVKDGIYLSGRYQVLSKIGAGGMADVYKAKDCMLNRYVAVKVLKKEYREDENFVKKFRSEAQAAAGLLNPNIVNVYDVGEDRGLYYMVMELVEGITLKEYVHKKGKLSSKEAISIAIQMCTGIEAAHNHHIIHRDIKPQNIIISKEGKVKVTDFGIARAASSNTINGNAMGSVHYISPEQAGGKYVDEKSDIYSLGITMFEMITGKVPFDGESTVTIALKHIQNSVPSIREYIPQAPVSIEKIILKCTQNKSDKRYPKISLLIADLKRALTEPDVDFVQIDATRPIGTTVMITDEEINQIRKGAGKTSPEKPEEDVDDIDAMSPKMDKAVTIGGVIAGIAALMVVAVILTVVLSDNSIKLPKDMSGDEIQTIDPRKTVVPNVLGMSSDEAEKALNEKSLGFEYDSNYVYSDVYAADQIVNQSEAPGSVVNKNITVKLIVSKGPERIQVPAGISRSDLDSAISKLDSVGLKYEITYEFSGNTIGTVISCSPTENASVNKKDIVKLVVSRGSQESEEKTATVPSLVNMKLAKAQQKISSSGFEIGNVSEEYSDTVKKGYVIRQTVKSGHQMPLGGTIGLVVSKGSEDAPKYTGSYTFALEDLHDADGNPITEGVVNVALDGVLQKVDPKYADVSTWPGDYTIELTGDKKGKATIELMVNGQVIHTGTVKLK